MQKTMMILAGAGALALSLAAPAANASTVVLTFDRSNSCVRASQPYETPRSCDLPDSSVAVSATYGSTAELGVTYSQYGNPYVGIGSGSYTFLPGGTTATDYIFTPAAGFEVSLASLQAFKTAPGGGIQTGTFSLYVPAGAAAPISVTPFATGTNTDPDTPTDITLVTFNTAYFSGPILLRGLATGGVQIDNITLNTRAIGGGGAVPEPATWAIMLTGFGLAGGLMRRRRQALRLA